MKTNTIAPVAISLALFACVNFADAESHLLPDRVYRAAQERVDAGYYPALVIGYVDGDRSEVDVFGKLDDGKTVDADTVFEIGSITKTFTATLLAEAVERGDLKLDAPLATLLPDFAIPSRNDRKITLLDIATQTSGLPRLPSNLKPAVPTDPYADYGAAELKNVSVRLHAAARSRRELRVFEPGLRIAGFRAGTARAFHLSRTAAEKCTASARHDDDRRYHHTRDA